MSVVVVMAFYQLQAKLRDGSVANLNFQDLNLSLNQLIEIDYFTNQYSSWDFLNLADTHVEHEICSPIDSFQISIKGKPFLYSSCFKNPYLEAMFNETHLNISKNHSRIPMSTPAFIEMVEFLFSNLDQRKNEFLNDYPYKNRFAEKIYRYLGIQPFSEEDMHEQRILRQQIIDEMSEYKVYRSLCIYRRNLDRKKNQIPRVFKKPASFSCLEVIPKNSKAIIYDDNDEEVVVGYASNWENSSGEEREEFLSEEEVRQMVKTYE